MYINFKYSDGKMSTTNMILNNKSFLEIIYSSIKQTFTKYLNYLFLYNISCKILTKIILNYTKKPTILS